MTLPVPEAAGCTVCDGQTTGVISRLRDAHEGCNEHRDLATASLIKNWIDDAARRVRFLYEAVGAN